MPDGIILIVCIENDSTVVAAFLHSADDFLICFLNTNKRQRRCNVKFVHWTSRLDYTVSIPGIISQGISDRVDINT